MNTAISEYWKWIDGYEGLYMISSHGRIMSFHKSQIGRILSTVNQRGDYLRIPLIDQHGGRSTALVHRLVASAFIKKIPFGWQVHHIDGNKQNNVLSNLEITSPKAHRVETKKLNPQITTGLVHYNQVLKPKSVLQYTLAGVFVAKYPNAKVAELATGVCRRNILQVASGTPYDGKGNTRKQAGGYIWRFLEESEGMSHEV